MVSYPACKHSDTLHELFVILACWKVSRCLIGPSTWCSWLWEAEHMLMSSTAFYMTSKRYALCGFWARSSFWYVLFREHRIKPLRHEWNKACWQTILWSKAYITLWCCFFTTALEDRAWVMVLGSFTKVWSFPIKKRSHSYLSSFLRLSLNSQISSTPHYW